MSSTDFRLLDLVDRPCYRDIHVGPDGRFAFRRRLTPGLYRLSVTADASGFDWDRLYLVLDQFGHEGQKSGPWNFRFDGDRSVIGPCYTVTLDGRRLDRWRFARPTCRHIEQRIMEGVMGLRITEAGEHTLVFEPTHPFTLHWRDVRFEVEPEDVLIPQRAPASSLSNNWLWQLGRPEVWARLQGFLDRVGRRFRRPVAQGAAHARTATRNPSYKRSDRRLVWEDALPLLIADYRLNGERASCGKAIEFVEAVLDAPLEWGDIVAGYRCRNAAIALNWLYDELGDRRDPLRARLEAQMDRYMDHAILHRWIWGASLMQDHGIRAFFPFGVAAFGLLGHSTRTAEWLGYVLPRVERMIRARPTDGTITFESYHKLQLYADHLALYREAHLVATGEDLYRHARLRETVRYLRAVLHEPTRRYLHPCPRGDLRPFYAAALYFTQLARDSADRDARHLLDLVTASPVGEDVAAGRAEHDFRDLRYYEGQLFAALSADERIESVGPAPPVRTGIDWFDDSGYAVYRNVERDVMLGVVCGPPISRTTYAVATSAQDRMVPAYINGTFVLTANGRRLIHSAEGGYRMHGGIGNILFIDGRGQRHDHGVPMADLGAMYEGEAIESVLFNPATGEGHILLNLRPAYDDDRRILRYLRRFRFDAAGDVLLEDILESDAPHRYTWRFNTFRDHALSADGLRYEIVRPDGPRASIEPLDAPEGLTATTGPTDTLWSYGDDVGGRKCHHIDYTLDAPAGLTAVAFRLRVEPNPSPGATA